MTRTRRLAVYALRVPGAISQVSRNMAAERVAARQTEEAADGPATLETFADTQRAGYAITFDGQPPTYLYLMLNRKGDVVLYTGPGGGVDKKLATVEVYDDGVDLVVPKPKKGK